MKVKERRKEEGHEAEVVGGVMERDAPPGPPRVGHWWGTC